MRARVPLFPPGRTSLPRRRGSGPAAVADFEDGMGVADEPGELAVVVRSV